MAVRTCAYWIDGVRCKKPTASADVEFCAEHLALLADHQARAAAQTAMPDRLDAIEALPVIVMNKPKDA